jgi:signal transduction histidine kinase
MLFGQLDSDCCLVPKSLQERGELMGPIIVMDSVALVAIVLAAFFMLRGWKCSLRHDIKVLFTMVIAVILFRSVSNFLEWSNISNVLEPFEDFIEILLPILWCFVIYAFLQEMAEKERERLNRSLAAKNKEMESMIYIASHDLGSPLVNIRGFSGELASSCETLSSLLDDETISSEKTEQIRTLIKQDIPESLSFINSGAESMKMLIEGLLRLSHAATEEISVGKLDMNSLVEHIRQSKNYQIKEMDVSFESDHLPDCCGDEKQVSQIFNNLIGNALKYLDPNRKGDIKISGKTDGLQSIYEVRDNGIGIAQKHQEKVFELFQRLNPNDTAGGEGLGLTIVSRMVERQNGSIRLESQLGKGTTFYVTLPRA